MELGTYPSFHRYIDWKATGIEHKVPRRLEDGTKGSRWSMLSRAMSTQHYGPPLHTGFMLKVCEHCLMALQWPVLKSRLITTVNWRSLQPGNSLVGLDNHLQFLLLSLEPTVEFLRQWDSDWLMLPPTFWFTELHSMTTIFLKKKKKKKAPKASN